MRTGKCVQCGVETSNFIGCARDDIYDDFLCDECLEKKIKKQHEQYEKDMREKVLPFLVENHFKVVVEIGKEIEEFPINDIDIMSCVNIIRERMKAKGYREIWIDVHTETINGVIFEVVDYLCFEKKGKRDIGVYIELIGKNWQKL